MDKLYSIKEIKKILKEKRNIENLSGIEVELEIPEGFIKKDYWSEEQYELYRNNSSKFPYILKSVKFGVFLNNPDDYGKIFSIGEL